MPRFETVKIANKSSVESRKTKVSFAVRRVISALRCADVKVFSEGALESRNALRTRVEQYDGVPVASTRAELASTFFG